MQGVQLHISKDQRASNHMSIFHDHARFSLIGVQREECLIGEPRLAQNLTLLYKILIIVGL